MIDFSVLGDVLSWGIGFAGIIIVCIVIMKNREKNG
jgi:hypothetical protein